MQPWEHTGIIVAIRQQGKGILTPQEQSWQAKEQPAPEGGGIFGPGASGTAPESTQA